MKAELVDGEFGEAKRRVGRKRHSAGAVSSPTGKGEALLEVHGGKVGVKMHYFNLKG